VTVYWPVFFGSAAAIFVTLNAVFAFFYWLGDRPIANVSDDLPLSLFYFSIETLATVDDHSAQRLHARQIYSRDDIRWQHRYRDITSLSERGRLLLDYTKFHEVDPEEV
jgi:hypothetical protein